jgi:hypothetical protein
MASFFALSRFQHIHSKDSRFLDVERGLALLLRQLHRASFASDALWQAVSMYSLSLVLHKRPEPTANGPPLPASPLLSKLLSRRLSRSEGLDNSKPAAATFWETSQ